MNRMKMPVVFLFLLCMGGAYALNTENMTKKGDKKPYQNAKLSVESRVKDLLSRMTIEEKVAELNLLPYYQNTDSICRALIREGKVGAFLKANGATLNYSLQKEAMKHHRLGIPLMFHEDVIHGYRTITPIPLAESCSWNPEMVRKSAAMAAREAAAAGIQLTYAPMVDISYDPRWGRISETSGEDTYVGKAMAVARVKGFQGNDLSDASTVAACVKHFAGYGEVTGGRDYQETDVSSRTLHEIYLPPFQAAIDAGVAAVMCAYTSYDGEPATMNHYMNTEVLRNLMHFNGLLMTDWTTLSHAISTGAAADGKESVERGIKSGIEMDMSSQQFSRHLIDLVKAGKVNESLIDNAVAHALELKFRMGLFEDPYKYFDEKREKRVLNSEESRQTAYEMACESMVLLKNERNLLPLDTSKSIALVGPWVDEREDILGSWSMKGQPNETVTVGDAFAKNTAGFQMTIKGCTIDGVTDTYINEVVALVRDCDVAVVCIGEPSSLATEGTGVAKLELREKQLRLLQALKAVGKPVVAVLFNGRPLILNEVVKNCDALLEAWYPGTMGGKAVFSLLTGEKSPSGKLTQSFPVHAGQIPVRYNPRRTFTMVNYQDIAAKPHFPFGYGLSYTHYTYSAPRSDKKNYAKGDTVTVTLKVTNKGDREGKETVQLYVHDKVSTVIPREKELKGFCQVVLAPGETKEVCFRLPSSTFECFNNKMEKVLEPGSFVIYTGESSEKVQSTEISFDLIK